MCVSDVPCKQCKEVDALQSSVLFIKFCVDRLSHVMILKEIVHMIYQKRAIVLSTMVICML